MLAQRVATALVGIPVILGLIALGGVPYSIAVAAVLVIAALEFYRATDPARTRAAPAAGIGARPLVGILPGRLPALLGATAVALLVAGAHNGADWWAGAFVLSVGVFFLALTLHGDPETGLGDWLWITGGLAYVGFLGSHLVFLRGLDDGRDWAILAIFATFATDTAAYFVGRAFGRIHITPHISPGKTLEGSFGGLIAGFVAVVFLNWVTGLRADAAPIIVLALLLPLAAEVGDLAESLIKRGGGVKDAGALVPGHGGFLDRLDSILFTVPLVYYFVIWAIL